MQASGQTIIMKLKIWLIIFGQLADFFCVYVTKIWCKTKFGIL